MAEWSMSILNELQQRVDALRRFGGADVDADALLGSVRGLDSDAVVDTVAAAIDKFLDA